MGESSTVVSAYTMCRCLQQYCTRPYKYSLTLYSLPSNKILALTKLKAFADDNFTVAVIMISVSDRVENIVEKGENAGYQHFLLFQQCFQKASYTGFLKVVIFFYIALID